MNREILYQWRNEIANNLSCLTAWQTNHLSEFSMGIIHAESCQQQQVARQVAEKERVESCARRWRRYLDNRSFPLERFFTEWTRWVTRQLKQEKLFILVDETKLADRLGAMVVGVAWENRCIPLAWRCYVANCAESYPAEGQVKMIEKLLKTVKQGIDDQVEVVVLADRGIGTSPALCRAVSNLGWHFLFRVTCQSKVCTDKGDFTIAKMVTEGEYRARQGKVFKQRGRIEARAIAIWTAGYDQPWALVTNDRSLDGFEYANRNWQEQAFRDLKSGGWQWQHCRIRHPDHLERLLVLLTMAYAWCVALGSQAVNQDRIKVRSLQKHANGKVRRYWSLFKEGIQYFFDYVHRESVFLSLNFIPDPRVT